MTYLIIGFLAYFMFRYRYAMLHFACEKLGMIDKPKPKPKKKLRSANYVQFFELEDVWPDKKEKKAS